MLRDETMYTNYPLKPYRCWKNRMGKYITAHLRIEDFEGVAAVDLDITHSLIIILPRHCRLIWERRVKHSWLVKSGWFIQRWAGPASSGV